MLVKQIAVSMLFSLFAAGSPLYASQMQTEIEPVSVSQAVLNVNANCPNGGNRALDGTGYQGGNGQQNAACVNENCPNDGVRALDGTGYQGGNSQQNAACVNENCPNDGVRALDGTGFQARNGQQNAKQGNRSGYRGGC